MLGTILGWLSGPLLDKLVGPALTVYRDKLAADNDAGRMAVDLAKRELDLRQREAELRSEERRVMPWHHPAMMLGYILVFYVGKVVVWDSALGLGETPAIKGAVGDWLGMVATFFIGISGAAGAVTASVQMLTRRR